MRWLIPAILTCIGVANLPPIAAGADRPIPQNPARQEKAYRDLLEWNRRTLGGAYEKVGKKDARWDKPAREALEAAARVAGKAIDPAAKYEDIYGPASKAVEAGCTDPLILFLYANSSRVPNLPEPAELERRWVAAATSMERSAYPPLRRALALYGAGMALAKEGNPSPAGRKEATRFFDSVLALLPRGGDKAESNAEAEQEWFLLSRDLVVGYRSLGDDLKGALGRVDRAMAKSPALKANRLQIKAYWLIMEGWEIRGGGFANTVTEENLRGFQAKNVEAYKVLKQAWAVDPKSYRTPTMLVSSMITLGGKRSEMEMWFRRAMELKDDNAVACSSKMSFIDPKWYGSREEMMEFGEACKATKNWRGGITLVGAGVHRRWIMQLDDEGVQKYMGSAEVWEDGKAVYEEYLSHYTTDNAVRSVFAGFAYLCGRYAESREQFKILGDKLVGSKEYTLSALEAYKDYFDRMDRIDEANAAEKAKRKAGAPK